jgi:protein-S-isoprenylcysteine O-methyltransferase Ste14
MDYSMHTFNTLLFLAAWLAYFIVHSVLASLAVKKWIAARWPDFMPAYRLAFNGVALVSLLPILWLMVVLPWPAVWQWQGAGKWVANGLSVLAVLGFVWSLRYYDMQEFLGLKQWRGHVTTAEDQESFQLSPLHRFVRHPWYFFAIILLWARDMNTAQFLTSVMASLYFTIGARLEERKLLVYHGERYRRYMERVPGLFPLPWKCLSATEAKKLCSD